MDDEVYFNIVLAVNYGATAIFYSFGIYVFLLLRLRIDKSALVTIVSYFICSLIRGITMSTVIPSKKVAKLEENDIYIIDLNSLYIAYLGIYLFTFEMREVYLSLNSDTAYEFFKKK
jgi:hypothetical protein